MCLMLSQRSLRLSSFLFILFSIYCSVAEISTILSSRSFIHSSALVILLLIPSSVYLFFNSYRSLVNFSCIFSIFASIVFLRSWIIFTIIILNYLLEGCLFPLHLVFFLRLSCPFIWDVTFCFIIYHLSQLDCEES